MSEPRCLVVGADAAVTASVAALVDRTVGLACAGAVDATTALAGVRPACDVVLVCDGPGRPAGDLAAPLIRLLPDVPVLLAAASVDLAAHRAAMAAGARGLVGLPPDADELAQAVRGAVDGRPAATAAGPAGLAVAVCAGKGGVGTSALALALAGAADGLLVDLAGGFDDAAQRLGCAGARGVSELAGLEHALGADAVRSVVSAHPLGLRLLARPALGDLVTPELCHALVRESRAVAGVTAFDLGQPPGHTAAAVAISCDRVLVATTPEPLAVACAGRLARWLDGEGVPGAGVAVVVNRWRRGAELSLRGIERSSGLPVAAVVREGAIGRGRTAGGELLRAIGAA